MGPTGVEPPRGSRMAVYYHHLFLRQGKRIYPPPFPCTRMQEHARFSPEVSPKAGVTLHKSGFPNHANYSWLECHSREYCRPNHLRLSILFLNVGPARDHTQRM